MKILSITSLAIPDIKVIRFARFPDHRGYFSEPFRRSDLIGHPDVPSLAGVEFVQANESFSRASTIRGLHFQWNPYMGKLVRAVAGHLIDFALDIRRDSPTLGRIVAHDMPAGPTDPHGEWIWVPPGFAHGTLLLKDTTLEYFCSGEYSPTCEAGISPLADDLDWSLCDPRLKSAYAAVLSAGPLLTDKDRNAPSLRGWLGDPRSENFRFGRS